MSSSPESAPKAKKSVALSGVPAGNTALCTVGRTGNDLHYRGYDILDIADDCEFEEVSYLLVHGKLPNQAELDGYKTTPKGYVLELGGGVRVRVIHTPGHTPGSICFEVVPEQTRPWNPEHAPHAIVTNRNGNSWPVEPPASQALNASSPKPRRQARITASDRKKPSVAVVWIQLVA